MAEFEKLQELWQHQPESPLAPVDAGALTRELGKYSRRQEWINIAKMVAIAVSIGAQFVYQSISPRAIAALGMVAAVAVGLLAIDWRNQRAIARLDFAAPSADFVRTAIRRLMEQREPFRKYYWPFMLTLVAALNLMVWSTLDDPGSWRERALRLALSALPFAVYELGKRVRIKRFETECRPLIDRLMAMLAALEERSE